MEFYVHLSEENIKALRGETDDESGGGESEQWETLFEGEVDTVLRNPNYAQAQTVISKVIDADEIKVTFNDVEYTCNKSIIQGLNGYGGIGEDGPDFSEYPFAIVSTEVDGNALMQVYTETEGTYSLKIEAQESGESGGESGGDSDLSIANVSITNYNGQTFIGPFILEITTPIQATGSYCDGSNLLSLGNSTQKIILYKGQAYVNIDGEPTISGNIEFDNVVDAFVITGDCSLTFGDGPLS